jgi:hypothetical protein
MMMCKFLKSPTPLIYIYNFYSPLLPHLVNDLRIKYLNQMIALPGFDIEFSREDEEWMYNATIAAETLEDITIAVDW